jgi:hypothetical protein
MIDFNFISSLSFCYEHIHKTVGMFSSDEPFYNVYAGEISRIRTESGLYPETIAYFELIILQTEKAKQFGALDDLIEILDEESQEVTSHVYNFKKYIVNHPKFDESDKVVFLRNLMILPEHRKSGVFEELIKSIFISHCSEKTFFVVNSKPIQSCLDDYDFHMNDNPMEVYGDLPTNPALKVEYLVGEYYGLDTLPPDDEENDFKLFARLMDLRMKKIKDSYYFYYEDFQDVWDMLNNFIKQIQD